MTEEQQRSLDQGQEYANATQVVLGKNLQSALSSNGAEYALSFCNERAMSLTDSMSVVQNVDIRRVSDKYRNPGSAANIDELAYIIQSKKRLSEGQSIEPHIYNKEDRITGYYPILTNGLCLQCHGTKENGLNQALLPTISQFYPDDRATGYNLNELRGIWVVELPKE